MPQHKYLRKKQKIPKKQYFKRQKKIHDEKVAKTKEAALENERKAQNLALLKEQLIIQIQEKYGGLWVDRKTVEEQLSKFETIKA